MNFKCRFRIRERHFVFRLSLREQITDFCCSTAGVQDGISGLYLHYSLLFAGLLRGNIASGIRMLPAFIFLLTGGRGRFLKMGIFFKSL